MVKHAKALALVLACCAIGCAVKPLDVATFPEQSDIRVVLSLEATQAIEQLASVTRFTRKEQAACATDYLLVTDSLHRVVVVLFGIGKSRPYDSDSLRVWTTDTRPFCEGSAASIHTHIVPNEAWGRPSQWDMEHQWDWTRAPFKLLVSVRDRRPSKLTVYGLR